MRRSSLAIAATSVLAAAALPAAASASEVQIGQTTSAVVAPTCPAGVSANDCTILLTKETGLETLSDGNKSPEVVKQPGVLSSYSLGISNAAIGFKAVKSLNTSYGGPPEAQVTVLRSLGTSTKGTQRWVVAAESPVQNLTQYQGQVVQFPLVQALPLVKGEVIAITTPTWAPVLGINQSTDFSYIQSRVGNCEGNIKLPSYFNPQLYIGQQSNYGCSYDKTRVEYSGTEITTPTIAAAYRLAARRRTISARPRVLSR